MSLGFDAVGAQVLTPLLTQLLASADRADTPFYAPGHKRGQGLPSAITHPFGQAVFRADLPELPALDNLFAPQGVIQAAQELAAVAFGAQRTWFLINGSTCGVIAAILATCEPEDKIILPRNVHRSAISGLILSGAVPIFVQPEYDPLLDLAHSITPEAVAAAIEQHPEAKAVMMVYPTYHGVCGDILAIADLAHQHGMPLLVDEAHGAHFAFHPQLPMSALAAGADLTVQSIHKTLSAMTQSAMLHVQGDRVDGDRVNQALQLVQSTSPSYLLLASLDAARQQMATQGKALMAQTLDLADQARSQINQIPGLSTLNPEQAGSPGFWMLDRTRLTVSVADLEVDGFTADNMLHQQFQVTAELPALNHLTFIISLGNTQADIEQLVQAFRALAGGLPKRAHHPYHPKRDSLSPPAGLSPRQAFFSAAETRPIAQTIGSISAELVCPYPPGIPVLMPGEVVTEVAIAELQQVIAAGGIVTGCADATLGTLRVVKQ